MRIAKNKSDWMSKPLSGDAPILRCDPGAGEDSSAGNVTGGRKLARYVFKSLINARAESAEIYLADGSSQVLYDAASESALIARSHSVSHMTISRLAV